ncbi:MAG: lipase family protein [Bacteriovoracia bacterium]
MKYILLFIFILSNARAQIEEVEAPALKYYVSCHKKLSEEMKKYPQKFEAALCDVSHIEQNFDSILKVVEELPRKNHMDYVAREKDASNEAIQEFLEKCMKETSDFHSKVGDLALEAYDISFLDRENPVLENGRGGEPPEGYKVSKYYGHNPESCYQTGFKGALFTSVDGKHVVFSITGTEGSDTYSNGKKRETYISQKSALGGLFGGGSKPTVVSAKDKDKEDWFPVTGSKQFSTSCAREMIRDAIDIAKKEGKKITFTGHSLGGAVAQGMAYRVQQSLLGEEKEFPPVEAVTFMGVGGRGLVKPVDEKVASSVDSISYVSLGDIVSGFGVHMGEIRELIRKEEYEAKFKSKELGLLETHSLKLDSCQPLENSLHISAVQRSQRCSAYFQELNKPVNQVPE